jgi:hypothetical protein
VPHALVGEAHFAESATELEAAALTERGRMLRYHVAFYRPKVPGEMVVAEALDFPERLLRGLIFRTLV